MAGKHIPIGSDVSEYIEAGLGGGGSNPTDTVIPFEETVGEGDSLPITGVTTGIGDGTFTIAGDHTAVLLDQTGVVVTGSTGNDGNYTLVADSTYDIGNDETTLTVGEEIASAVADGDLILPVTYTYTFDLPANRAIEWVFASTEETWDSFRVNLRVGTPGQPFAFSKYTIIESADANPWQWPTATLGDPENDVDPMGGPSRKTYQRFPAGTTVTVEVRAGGMNGTAGRSTVVVHHHDTEPAASSPVRDPVS